MKINLLNISKKMAALFLSSTLPFSMAHNSFAMEKVEFIQLKVDNPEILQALKQIYDELNVDFRAVEYAKYLMVDESIPENKEAFLKLINLCFTSSIDANPVITCKNFNLQKISSQSTAYVENYYGRILKAWEEVFENKDSCTPEEIDARIAGKLQNRQKPLVELKNVFNAATDGAFKDKAYLYFNEQHGGVVAEKDQKQEIYQGITFEGDLIKSYGKDYFEKIKAKYNTLKRQYSISLPCEINVAYANISNKDSKVYRDKNALKVNCIFKAFEQNLVNENFDEIALSIGEMVHLFLNGQIEGVSPLFQRSSLIKYAYDVYLDSISQIFCDYFQFIDKDSGQALPDNANYIAAAQIMLNGAYGLPKTEKSLRFYSKWDARNLLRNFILKNSGENQTYGKIKEVLDEKNINPDNTDYYIKVAKEVFTPELILKYMMKQEADINRVCELYQQVNQAPAELNYIGKTKLIIKMLIENKLIQTTNEAEENEQVQIFAGQHFELNFSPIESTLSENENQFLPILNFTNANGEPINIGQDWETDIDSDF